MYSQLDKHEKQIVESLSYEDVKLFEQLSDDLVANPKGRNGVNEIKTKVAGYRVDELISDRDQNILDKYSKKPKHKNAPEKEKGRESEE